MARKVAIHTHITREMRSELFESMTKYLENEGTWNVDLREKIPEVWGSMAKGLLDPDNRHIFQNEINAMFRYSKVYSDLRLVKVTATFFDHIYLREDGTKKPDSELPPEDVDRARKDYPRGGQPAVGFLSRERFKQMFPEKAGNIFIFSSRNSINMLIGQARRKLEDLCWSLRFAEINDEEFLSQTNDIDIAVRRESKDYNELIGNIGKLLETPREPQPQANVTLVDEHSTLTEVNLLDFKE